MHEQRLYVYFIESIYFFEFLAICLNLRCMFMHIFTYINSKSFDLLEWL